MVLSGPQLVTPSMEIYTILLHFCILCFGTTLLDCWIMVAGSSRAVRYGPTKYRDHRSSY